MENAPSFESAGSYSFLQGDDRRYMAKLGNGERSLGLLAWPFSEGRFEDWDICDALLPHIYFFYNITNPRQFARLGGLPSLTADVKRQPTKPLKHLHFE
jgi:hypothetical protein